MNYEVIGIMAGLLVVISFLFRKEKTIRIVNIFGSIVFIIYGILINSLSILLLNTILIVIHLYYLLRSQQ